MRSDQRLLDKLLNCESTIFQNDIIYLESRCAMHCFKNPDKKPERFKKAALEMKVSLSFPYQCDLEPIVKFCNRNRLLYDKELLKKIHSRLYHTLPPIKLRVNKHQAQRKSAFGS